jgi:ATP-binding cassette subfamily C (CFTR/MRP) protein 10
MESEKGRESEGGVPDVSTLMSVDTSRAINLAASVHEFWSLPLQILVALYLLYTQVGR